MSYQLAVNRFDEVSAKRQTSFAGRSLGGNEQKKIGKHFAISINAVNIGKIGRKGGEAAQQKASPSGETALATICESKEGSKSTTDSEKVGICSESKSSISSPEDIEDSAEMGEMADFGTEPGGESFEAAETLTNN
jgi:hypothetical protein